MTIGIPKKHDCALKKGEKVKSQTQFRLANLRKKEGYCVEKNFKKTLDGNRFVGHVSGCRGACRVRKNGI